MTFCILQ